MRWVLGIGVVAGCYQPAEIECARCLEGVCPAGLTCTDGYCTRRDAACPDGLVRWWPFDEGQGDIAADVVGGGASTLRDGAVFEPGHHKTAIGFPVTTVGLVTSDADRRFDNLGPLTISAWIRPLTFDNPNEGSPRIVVKESSLGAATGKWLFLVDTSVCGGCLAFAKAFSDRELRRRTPTGSLLLDQWQHVAVTWDGTPTMAGIRLYVRGTEIPEGTGTDGAGDAISDEPSGITIGNTPDGMRGFVGGVDEVRIYDRVLGADQIAALAAR